MDIQRTVVEAALKQTVKILQMGQQLLLSVNAVEYLAVPVYQASPYFERFREVRGATVFLLSALEKLSPQWIQKQINEWLQADDVFEPSFLREVVIFSEESDLTEEMARVRDSLKQNWGTNTCTLVPASSSKPRMSPGPYFVCEEHIYKPFKLYDDVKEAFILATKPRFSGSTGFENLRLSGAFPPSLSIAVTSRIAEPEASSRPLKGMRFAVKDLFEIRGLRPTVGCRAYYKLTEQATTTAPVLQKLIDLGAELVGTLKLGSLITKEEPAESADYQAPFNPRGDGYQSAWSSSGGSGAAIASYDWLDFALGTDTTGSSRRPAMANGCFQLRLSHDALPQKGIVPSFRPFDSPAIFTRSIREIEKVVPTWINPMPSSYDDHPLRVVYLTDYFPVGDKIQQDMLERFLADLASTLRAETARFSLRELWNDSSPSEAQGHSLSEWLENVGVNSFCYGLYHELDEFRLRYHQRFHKEPYVNPTTRWRWNAARNVTADQYDSAMSRLRTYKTWLLDHVLQTEMYNSLILIPITTQAEDYRDQPADPPSAPDAFQPLWLAPILGAPEFSIPIGETKYYSRVSQQDEYLPIVASILGAPGTDTALIRAVAMALERSGRPTSVFTGSRMFERIV